MRPNFHQKLLNDAFGDPCLFVRILREKRALLFDLGDIGGLKPAEINRISDVFVTHTHIDHFIGFDPLLRVILRRDMPLNIYGPPNIAACVAGKLRGYTWNLIRDYPTVIHVHAFDGSSVSRSTFRAATGFRREASERWASEGVILKEPAFRVRAARLTHGTPCIAYSLEEEFRINVDKDRLRKRGFEVGPWLSRLKKIMREPEGEDRRISVSGKTYPVHELSDLVRITKGQKISYASDIAMTPLNLKRLGALIAGSDLFYCETYFLDRDSRRARERFHLTAGAAGRLAREAGAVRLVPMHLSPKYRGCPADVIEEAMTEFRMKVS